MTTDSNAPDVLDSSYEPGDGIAEAQLGLRVFSATRSRDRELLGEVITEWIRSNPQCRVFDRRVLQSSDADFHCFTIVLLFHYRG